MNKFTALEIAKKYMSKIFAGYSVYFIICQIAQMFLSNGIDIKIYSAFIAPAIEETIKSLIGNKNKKFIVTLTFSILENIEYMVRANNINVFWLRMVITTPMHLISAYASRKFLPLGIFIHMAFNYYILYFYMV